MSVIHTHAIRTQELLDELRKNSDEAQIGSLEDVYAAVGKVEGSIGTTESILGELEMLRAELVMSGGLTRANYDQVTAVAGESLLSKSISATLTSRPQPRFLTDTVVAVESLMEKLKYGALAAIIAIVLKIIGWLLSRGAVKTDSDIRAFAEEVKVNVMKSDDLTRAATSRLLTDICKNAYMELRDELMESHKINEVQLSNMGANLSTLDTHVAAFLHARSSHPEGRDDPGVLELLHSVGIDVVKRTIMGYVTAKGEPALNLIIDPWELLRAYMKELIDTNVGATAMPLDHAKAAEDLTFYPWYYEPGENTAKPPTKLNTAWGITGCRVYCTASFKGFDKSYEQLVNDVQTHLELLLGALNKFIKVYDPLHDRNDEDARSRLYALANVSERDLALAIINDFPDEYAGVPKNQVIDFIQRVPIVGNALYWMCLYMITSRELIPLTEQNNDYGPRAVNPFMRIGTKIGYKSDILPGKGFNTSIMIYNLTGNAGDLKNIPLRETYNIKQLDHPMFIHEDDLKEGDPNDGKPAYSFLAEGVPKQDPSEIMIPTRLSIPGRHLVSKVDGWSVEQLKAMAYGFSVFGDYDMKSRSVTVYDDSKLTRLYKQIEDTCKKIEKRIKSVERWTATRGTMISNLGAGRLRTAINEPVTDALVFRRIMETAYYTQHKTDLTMAEHRYEHTRFYQMLRDINAMGVFKDYMTKARMLAEFSSAAKNIASELNRSPLKK